MSYSTSSSSGYSLEKMLENFLERNKVTYLKIAFEIRHLNLKKPILDYIATLSMQN